MLARRVDDVALGVEVINSGRTPEVEPPMPLGDPRAVNVSRLRVAYYTDDGALAVAPAVRRAVCEAADVLRSRGAQVTVWSPPDAGYAADLFLGILSADGGRGFQQKRRPTGWSASCRASLARSCGPGSNARDRGSCLRAP